MSKSLLDLCNEKNIITITQLGAFLSGRKLKTIKPKNGILSGHNYKTKIVAQKIIWQNSNAYPATKIIGANSGYQFCESKYGTSNIYLTELALDDETKEDIEHSLKIISENFLKEESELRNKLDIMNKFKIDIYDEQLINLINAMDNIQFKEDCEMDKVKLAKILIEKI